MRSTAFIVFALCSFLYVSASPLTVKGGVKQLDQSKHPELIEIITEALEQLKTDQGHQWEFVEFAAAPTYQTVSGAKYTASTTFKNSGAADNFTCDIEIWEQPWANFRDFEAKCPEKTYKVVKGTQAS